MPDVDLILLHAPSIYDFRKLPTMHGPISDVIPSTPVFEMYPLGFVSMVGYLEQNGYKARIINLAVKMLNDPNFDVDRFVSKLNTKAFGFDLHWLIHAGGSLDIAKIIKKHHPNTPIIFGGLSSTYFHEEIIEEFPQVDYIIRGDTTEKPLLDLIKHIEKEKAPETVENLTWRSEEGKKHVNPLSYVPVEMDDLWVDYGEVLKLVLKYRDLESTLPYSSFMEYPFTALFTCKGCSYNCITCGGSNYSFKKFFNRSRPVFKTPEKLVEEITIISQYFKAPIFLIGDLRQGGIKWAEKVLTGIKGSGIDNTITYELFDTVPDDWMNKLAGSTANWTLEISPETHDDKLRKIMGKPYTNEQMEKTVKNALAKGTKKIDIYFMVGLSGQTYKSVMESVDYARNLYEMMEKTDKIYTFISPLAPFLDPGSMVYETPEIYGFNRLYKDLKEHKEALNQPSWKHYLSYDTKWMNRDEIADATYKAMIKMNQLKMDVGVVDIKHGESVQTGLNMALDIMNRIDHITKSVRNPLERNAQYLELKAEIETSKFSTNLAKKELRMPGLAGVRIKGALRFILKSFGL